MSSDAQTTGWTAKPVSMDLMDPLYGVDPVAWRGVAQALLATASSAEPSVLMAAALLEHTCAGLLFRSLTDRRRAMRAHTDVSSAAGHLEWAGLVACPPPPPKAKPAPVGPVGWVEVRDVLDMAIIMLGHCIQTVPDPIATARAVLYARDALTVIDDG